VRRRRAVALAAIAAIALSAGGARAEGWPEKPIRVIVPYPPGGIGDTGTRAIVDKLRQRLGQAFIVDNKPGASQILGAELTAHAPSDGYTLFLGSLSSLVLNLYTKKTLPYDPVKSFAPVSLLFNAPLFLVVNPKLPAHSVTELIALAKKQPGQLSYASIGPGSSLHLAGELFQSMTGTEMLHVPYKGSAPADNDLLANQVQLIFDAGPSVLPHVEAGSLRALAVTTAHRFSGWPDLPTIAESGVPGYEMATWFGLVAPAGTALPIRERLSIEIAAVIVDPALKQRFLQLGVELESGTPAELAALIERDLAKWGPVIQHAHLDPE
jgi:tripartite-type tricarboxylate transporter receptor subunit TctC